MKFFMKRIENSCGKADKIRFGIGLQTPYEYYSEDSSAQYNNFYIYFWKSYWWWKVPMILKPVKVWKKFSNGMTHSGKEGYWDFKKKAYSIKIGEGYLHWQKGIQSDSWPHPGSGCYALPWCQINQIRHEVFELQTVDGKTYPNELKRIEGKFTSHVGRLDGNELSVFQQLNVQRYEIKDRVESFYHGKDTPYFVFVDYVDPYDGKVIKARCHVEEREWHYGYSHKSKLNKFWKFIMSWKPHIVNRTLDFEFQEETGPEKGSWKGGTMGTGHDLLPGESVEECLVRYGKERGMK